MTISRDAAVFAGLNLSLTSFQRSAAACSLPICRDQTRRHDGSRLVGSNQVLPSLQGRHLCLLFLMGLHAFTKATHQTRQPARPQNSFVLAAAVAAHRVCNLRSRGEPDGLGQELAAARGGRGAGSAAVACGGGRLRLHALWMCARGALARGRRSATLQCDIHREDRGRRGEARGRSDRLHYGATAIARTRGRCAPRTGQEWCRHGRCLFGSASTAVAAIAVAALTTTTASSTAAGASMA